MTMPHVLKAMKDGKKVEVVLLIMIIALAVTVAEQRFGITGLDEKFTEYMEYYGEIEAMYEAALELYNDTQKALETTLNSTWYALQQPASYVVSKVAAYTCLQNGTTGALDDYSTNSSLVIEWMYGNCSGGEKLVMRAANYSISVPIVPKNNTWLQGEGGYRTSGTNYYGTVLSLADNVDDSVIKFSADYNHGIKITDLAIYGNNGSQTAGHGIYAQGKNINCRLENLEIGYTKENGMTLGSGASMGFHNWIVNVKIVQTTGIGFRVASICEENWFLNCATGYCTLEAWSVSSAFNSFEGIKSINDLHTAFKFAEGKNVVNDFVVDQCGRRAILLDGSASDNTFTNGIIFEASYDNSGTFAAIKVDAVHRNTFVNVKVGKFGGTAYHKYSLEITATSEDTKFTNGHLEDALTSEVLDGGIRTVIQFNTGFWTENKGMVVNASATTWTITHGLNGTPTGVWCSFNSTEIDSWKWTSTSTTITVTCVNIATADVKRACYWMATYKP